MKDQCSASSPEPATARKLLGWLMIASTDFPGEVKLVSLAIGAVSVWWLGNVADRHELKSG